MTRYALRLVELHAETAGPEGAVLELAHGEQILHIEGSLIGRDPVFVAVIGRPI